MISAESSTERSVLASVRLTKADMQTGILRPALTMQRGENATNSTYLLLQTVDGYERRAELVVRNNRGRAMIRFIQLIVLSFVMSLSAASSQPANSTYYHVTMKISEGGRVVGNPQFVMTAGSTATIIKATEGGYSLKSTLQPAGQSNDQFQLATDLLFAKAGVWTRVGRPSVSSTLNQTSMVTIPGANATPVMVEIKISRDFSGKFSSTQNFGKNKCTAAKLASWNKAMQSPLKVILASAQITDNNGTGGCCSPCSGMTCCSSGPMCCSDAHICPGGSCCN